MKYETAREILAEAIELNEIRRDKMPDNRPTDRYHIRTSPRGSSVLPRNPRPWFEVNPFAHEDDAQEYTKPGWYNTNPRPGRYPTLEPDDSSPTGSRPRKPIRQWVRANPPDALTPPGQLVSPFLWSPSQIPPY